MESDFRATNLADDAQVAYSDGVTMTSIAIIYLAFKTEYRSLMGRLRSVYDDANCARGFYLKLPLEDPRTKEAIRLLHDAGFHPYEPETKSRGREKYSYIFTILRSYDMLDLASCSFLELRPPSEAVNKEAIFRAHNGEMIIPEKDTPVCFDIMCGSPFSYFVPERVKFILEANKLHHVLFRPTVHVPNIVDSIELDGVVYSDSIIPDMDKIAQRGRLPSDPVHHWELDSDVSLAPLSPNMLSTDLPGQPFLAGDFADDFPQQGRFYSHPELRYQASDLDGLEPFDLARTYGSFGNRRSYTPLDYPLIASKHFYECCVRHGVKTGWAPVRIDDN